MLYCRGIKSLVTGHIIKCYHIFYSFLLFFPELLQANALMIRKAAVVSFLTVLVNHCVQAMFTCGLKETQGGEIPLRDTSAQSLRLLLDYMYRGELQLSNNNIQEVAVAAFLLHVDGAFR